MFPYENGTTGIKNLDFNSFIQEQDISIPDIKTQQKIVSILSSIDEKIETNKRINDKFSKLIEGNLLDGELAGHEFG